MRVLIFHPTLLPPKDYGGVERVVLWLALGLKQLGCQVWVGAHPGSRLPEGVELYPVEPDHASARVLIERPPEVDFVHFMAPPEEGVSEGLGIPSLLTVHGNGKEGEEYSRNTVFLSRDHARRHGAECFIYNGIDPSETIFAPLAKHERFLFLSKTSWKVKNLEGAMRLSKKAGVGLEIAGGNRPLGLRLRAGLDSRFFWRGPVAGKLKAKLLSEARGLLFPVQWPEPFGLVVAEALMSGTPVFASNLGSLPELVPAEVGRVIPLEDTPAWVDALKTAAENFKPQHCRDWAMDQFHYMKMATAYLSLYGRVASGEYLNSEKPMTQKSRG